MYDDNDTTIAIRLSRLVLHLRFMNKKKWRVIVMVLVCLNVLPYMLSQSSELGISRRLSTLESKSTKMNQEDKIQVHDEAAAEREELMRLRDNVDWNKFLESISHGRDLHTLEENHYCSLQPVHKLISDMGKLRKAPPGEGGLVQFHEWTQSFLPIETLTRSSFLFKYWLHIALQPPNYVFNLWVSEKPEFWPDEALAHDQDGRPMYQLFGMPLDRVRVRFFDYQKEVARSALGNCEAYRTPQTVAEYNHDGPTFLSDVIRYILLHNYGGFYLDGDTVAIQSLEPLVQLGLSFIPAHPYMPKYHDNSFSNGHLLYTPRARSRMSQIALETMCWHVTAEQKKTPTLQGVNLQGSRSWIINSGMTRLLNLRSSPNDVPGSQFRLPMWNFDPGWSCCFAYYYDREFKTDRESQIKRNIQYYFLPTSQERLDYNIAHIGNYTFTIHTRQRKHIGDEDIPKRSFVGYYHDIALDFATRQGYPTFQSLPANLKKTMTSSGGTNEEKS
jgi:hypothetical protein